MRPIDIRVFLKAILVIALIGFALSGGLSIAEAQESPQAPSSSIFLPNIASGLPSGKVGVVYNFTSDWDSESVWNDLVALFSRFGTTLTRKGTALGIVEEHDGMQHLLATIRCVGTGCPADADALNEEPKSGQNVVEDIGLLVRLDKSRGLLFRPVSENEVDLALMIDDEAISEIRFTCDGCIIEVTINDPSGEPTPNPTSGSSPTASATAATPLPATVTAAPTTATRAPSSTTTPGSTATPARTVTPSRTVTPGSTAVPSATPVPAGSFVEPFDGEPSSPQPWTSENWDITVHSRDRETHVTLQGMHAHHGEHCEPPMATHHISAYQDAVFQCRNHMMTAINASGYGLIYLTPAYQVDFTEGTATIRFDMSTLRTSHRDWVDLYISPMEDHLQLALDDWLPDLSGEPKNAIKVKMDVFNGKTPFRAYVIKDHTPYEVDSKWWVPYEDYLEPSASQRTTFELQISRTHIKFGIPEYNLWWVDSDIEPLDWSMGVVQIGHHSYNPTKDCVIAGGCSANTWHWDNVMIDPARPFTMIHATQRHVDAASGASVSFESPAPADAYLRFAGIGKNMEVSFDGGKSWEAARVQEQVSHSEEAFWSYFTPIPAGVNQVKFRAQNWWGGNWLVRDLTIWAE